VTLPLLDFSAKASLHRARAAPRWHPSYLVGFRSRAPQFALLASRVRITRIFTVIASARPGRRSMPSTPLVRPQRLLTSRAHRLRKPHRTIRPLTSSVAGQRPERALHALQSSPPCQATAHRHGFSTTVNRYQDAFRWIKPRSCDRRRLTLAPFDIRARSPRTLSPTANRPPSSPGDRRVKLTRAGGACLSTRLTRQRRCVYPASATDLRHAHSADRMALESPHPLAFAGMTASTPPARSKP